MDQFGRFKTTQMPGYGRLGNIKYGNQFTDAAIARTQQRDDFQPGRIGKGFQRIGQFLEFHGRLFTSK
jgi:hypothetical protein